MKTSVLRGTEKNFGHYGKRPSETQVKKMHGLYLCGMSLTKCGKRFGLTRQWVWMYFKQFNLPTRQVKRREQIEYNGLKYTFNTKGYWRCTSGDRHILHYRVWKDNTGEEVPKGYEVLFKDGNKNNYQFSNLELIKGHGTISRMKKKEEG